MEGVKIVGEEKITTPFGDPVDSYMIGHLEIGGGKVLEGCELVFLPRHGRGHRFTPSEVNYRANIWGMKKLGVEWIIGVSAVGSLQKEIERSNLVLVDQFIDKTVKRETTFFGNGIVGHAGFGDPCCDTLRKYLAEACTEEGVVFHGSGTYVNMEGPQFSTRAESELHRSWGASVIGMTVCAEAKLCKEAEISYAVLAMATDYDCWKTDEEDVSVAAVVATLNKNVGIATNVVRKCIPKIIAHKGDHPMKGFMEMAIMTKPELMPKASKAALGPIIGQYHDCPEWTPEADAAASSSAASTQKTLLFGIAVGFAAQYVFSNYLK